MKAPSSETNIIRGFHEVNKKIRKTRICLLTKSAYCGNIKARNPRNALSKGANKIKQRINIEAERGRLQYTKTDMCRELGVTLKTYNGYIQGAMIPSTVLEQLKALTGKSVDYLLGLSEKPE